MGPDPCALAFVAPDLVDGLAGKLATPRLLGPRLREVGPRHESLVVAHADARVCFLSVDKICLAGQGLWGPVMAGRPRHCQRAVGLKQKALWDGKTFAERAAST